MLFCTTVYFSGLKKERNVFRVQTIFLTIQLKSFSFSIKMKYFYVFLAFYIYFEICFQNKNSGDFLMNNNKTLAYIGNIDTDWGI